jgi:predicted metal-dependent phosphotriesterase family hydrolase
MFYKTSGGGTIVENTSYGIKRNIPLMQSLSRESGVHIIAGTGPLFCYVYLCNVYDKLICKQLFLGYA